jgi:hypothetical protein
LESDLWFGEYNPNGYPETIDLDINFVDGSYHFINISGMRGPVNGVSRSFNDYSNRIQMFDGQTYNLFITDSDPFEGYSNCKSTTRASGMEMFGEICTDKSVYPQGESINFRYRMPTGQTLYDHYFPGDYWYLWIYDKDNLLWDTTWWDGGQSADNYAYVDNYRLSLDANYHYFYWSYNPSGDGYKTVTGGVDEYKAILGHAGGHLFGWDINYVSVDFRITKDDFTPHGNITSITPDPPQLGQLTNISFNANNNGYLTYRNLFSAPETEITITNFQKFSGQEFVNWQFWEFGVYELKLYVANGIEFSLVDSYTVSVTDINGTYGGYGYNVEFLTSEPYRAVAGYDTLFVTYRSLDENGTIIIKDPRGQQTAYSTKVGVKYGILNITIPGYAEIGEWNITLNGVDTLYSNFYVVADENNYIEFRRNIYYDNEFFDIKLKHDKKVEVVFHKDGLPYGRDWYLDVGIFPQGIYDVPIDVVIPTKGTWKVELWQVNNFVKIKKLAEDTTTVIETPLELLTDGGYQDIFAMLTQGASSIAGGEFGLAFMALIFILATIVALAQFKLKNDTIFLGAIAMMLFMTFIGWLPIWITVISIILAGFLFSSAFSKKLKIGS